MERKEILRVRLSAEDILLNWMHSGVNLSVQIKIEQRGKDIQISLLLDGLSYSVDPMDPDNQEESSLVDNLMAVLGISWIYQYDHGRNIVYTSVTVKKRNNLTSVGIALLTAAFIIMILRLLPEQIRNGIQTYGIDLVYGYCSRFLTAIVSPMMFLAVVQGILSVGSPRYLKKEGKYVCWYFGRSIIFILIAAGIVCAVFFSVHVDFSMEGGFLPVYTFISEIIPENILTPFVEQNMIQIIFMGAATGIAMLFLQHQVQGLYQIVKEANLLIYKLISGFEVGIMVFLCLSMVQVGMMADISRIVEFLKMLILYVVFLLAAVFIYFLIASRRTGIAIKEMWNRLKLTAHDQILSASSSFAFSRAYDVCESSLGIEKKLVNFALPVGTVIHKPFIAAEFVFVVSAAKSVQGESMDISNLILLILLALIVSMAYPPVSGGELGCYTILLTQMGLPVELLAFMCTISSLLDFLEAPANTLATELQLLHIDRRLKQTYENRNEK